MHQEVLTFLEGTKQANPELFKNVHVIEYGSYDVNGSSRQFFEDSNTTGIDWRAGKLVDVVSLMHELQDFDGTYDVAISSSAIEHDPYWQLSLYRCIQLLKVGGSLMITCGGPAYEKHCEITAPTQDGYYKGISSKEIIYLFGKYFESVEDKSDAIGRDVMILFKGKI